MKIEDIPVKEIFADHETNCRKQNSVSSKSVGSLAESMKRHGLMQPIVLHPYKKEGYKYRIISGHRRFVAANNIGWETIPAVVRQELSEDAPESAFLNLIENIERSDLHIVDEALALKRIFARGTSITEAARELSQTSAWVKLRFDMLQTLTEQQLEALRERGDKVRQTTLRQLVRIKDPEERIKALRDVLEKIDRGGKATNLRILKQRPKMSDRRVRAPHEIEKMINAIMDNLGPGLGTRALAWCAGNISDGELLDDVKRTCVKVNIPFKLPEDYK